MTQLLGKISVVSAGPDKAHHLEDTEESQIGQTYFKVRRRSSKEQTWLNGCIPAPV